MHHIHQQPQRHPPPEVAAIHSRFVAPSAPNPAFRNKLYYGDELGVILLLKKIWNYPLVKIIVVSSFVPFWYAYRLVQWICLALWLRKSGPEDEQEADEEVELVDMPEDERERIVVAEAVGGGVEWDESTARVVSHSDTEGMDYSRGLLNERSLLSSPLREPEGSDSLLYFSSGEEGAEAAGGALGIQNPLQGPAPAYPPSIPHAEYEEERRDVCQELRRSMITIHNDHSEMSSISDQNAVARQRTNLPHAPLVGNRVCGTSQRRQQQNEPSLDPYPFAPASTILDAVTSQTRHRPDPAFVRTFRTAARMVLVAAPPTAMAIAPVPAAIATTATAVTDKASAETTETVQTPTTKRKYQARTSDDTTLSSKRGHRRKHRRKEKKRESSRMHKPPRSPSPSSSSSANSSIHYDAFSSSSSSSDTDSPPTTVRFYRKKRSRKIPRQRCNRRNKNSSSSLGTSKDFTSEDDDSFNFSDSNASSSIAKKPRAKSTYSAKRSPKKRSHSRSRPAMSAKKNKSLHRRLGRYDSSESSESGDSDSDSASINPELKKLSDEFKANVEKGEANFTGSGARKRRRSSDVTKHRKSIKESKYNALPETEADLPPTYAARIHQVGFGFWNTKYLPCIIASPFDFEHGTPFQKNWLTMAKAHLKQYQRLDTGPSRGSMSTSSTKDSREEPLLPILVYWFTDRTYSIIPGEKFIPWSKGKQCWHDLPPKISSKLKNNKPLNASERLIHAGLRDAKEQAELPLAKRWHPEQLDSDQSEADSQEDSSDANPDITVAKANRDFTELPKTTEDLPASYSAKFHKIGFGYWNRKHLPCIITSPFDFEPGNTFYKAWMTMAKNHLKEYARLDSGTLATTRQSQRGKSADEKLDDGEPFLPLLVYWFTDRTYSVIPAEKFTPWSKGKQCWKEVTPAIARKLQKGMKLNATERLINDGLKEAKEQANQSLKDRWHPEQLALESDMDDSNGSEHDEHETV